MLDKKKIGSQLKELRLSRGWRQSEVADRVNLSRPAISNLEAGKRALTLTTLQRFCELYQIDISYFGIETSNFDESLDLTSRIEAIFNSSDISEEKKDELHRNIMEIYINSKNKNKKTTL